MSARAVQAATIAIALTLILAGSAFAKEEVVLKDGTSGMVTVLETTADSVTVKHVGPKATVTLKLLAKDMDPHSYYDIRRRNMEDTAQNHLDLAVFCAESGMFSRGKMQYELAVAMDPSLVQKLSQMPQMMDGIAKRLLAAAEKSLAAEEFATAERQASIVVTRFAGTAAAEAAGKLLETVTEKAREKEQAEIQARLEQVDEDARQAAADREKVLSPLRTDRDKGRELKSRALRESNQGKSKNLFEAAAASSLATLKKIEARHAKAHGDPELQEDLGRLVAGVKADAVSACVNAGSISLSRAAYTEAQTYARKAQGIDPESSVAKAFHARVETAIAMKDDIDVRARRPRTGRR